MRKGGFVVFRLLLILVYCSAVFLLNGCKGAQPGESAAEVKRRHERIETVRSQQLRSDVDKLFLIDKPSKLGDKRLP